MMHVGFETTPVLGAQRQFGDTWKMLKWQFSGQLGGNPRQGRATAAARTAAMGMGRRAQRTPMPPPASREELVSPDGRLRVL